MEDTHQVSTSSIGSSFLALNVKTLHHPKHSYFPTQQINCLLQEAFCDYTNSTDWFHSSLDSWIWKFIFLYPFFFSSRRNFTDSSNCKWRFPPEDSHTVFYIQLYWVTEIIPFGFFSARKLGWSLVCNTDLDFSQATLKRAPDPGLHPICWCFRGENYACQQGNCFPVKDILSMSSFVSEVRRLPLSHSVVYLSKPISKSYPMPVSVKNSASSKSFNSPHDLVHNVLIPILQMGKWSHKKG